MDQEQKLDAFLETFDIKNNLELKRIYRCPHCDAIVLEKVAYNYNHFCSCGVITHANNLKLEFEGK